MLLVWRRFGIIVPFIGIGALILVQALINAIQGQGTYESHTSLYAGIAMLVAAGISYLFAQWLSGREQPRRLQDPVTGHEVVLQRSSSFMLIPVRYWTYIYLGIAAISFILLLAAK